MPGIIRVRSPDWPGNRCPSMMANIHAIASIIRA